MFDIVPVTLLHSFGHSADFAWLGEEIVPFNMQHNAEVACCSERKMSQQSLHEPKPTTLRHPRTVKFKLSLAMLRMLLTSYVRSKRFKRISVGIDRRSDVAFIVGAQNNCLPLTPWHAFNIIQLITFHVICTKQLLLLLLENDIDCAVLESWLLMLKRWIPSRDWGCRNAVGLCRLRKRLHICKFNLFHCCFSTSMTFLDTVHDARIEKLCEEPSFSRVCCSLQCVDSFSQCMWAVAIYSSVLFL